MLVPFHSFSLSVNRKETLVARRRSSRRRWHELQLSCYRVADSALWKGSAQPSAEAACCREWIIKCPAGMGFAHRAAAISSHPLQILRQSILLLTPKTSVLQAKKQCMTCFIATSNLHSFSLQKQHSWLQRNKESRGIRDRRKCPDGRLATEPK
jgi:hypothetical protein